MDECLVTLKTREKGDRSVVVLWLDGQLESKTGQRAARSSTLVPPARWAERGAETRHFVHQISHRRSYKWIFSPS